jgi:CheY-like chemotaxis protein
MLEWMGRIEAKRGSGERTKGPLVLIVEDSPDVRAVFVELLTREGFTVLEADNGHAAVVKAQARRPDVILMDISLPLMDGARATRVLRSDERTRKIPILALTGRTLEPHDISLFDHVLSKPCSPERLLRRVLSVLSQQRLRDLASSPRR